MYSSIKSPNTLLRHTAISLYLVTLLGLSLTVQAANWGKFQKKCVSSGVAKYSAVLHGIPIGHSWENACRNKGARINGKYRNRPSRCVNTRSNMWGEFVVRDRSCRRPKPIRHSGLRWGSFKNNGCVIQNRKGWGYRSYSSVLWGIPPGQSWEKTCAKMPARVAGKYFSHPTACVKSDMKDVAKITKVVAKQIAKVAKRTKHPKVYLAARGTAIIASVIKGINPALNIWGVFYVEDKSCPSFGF